jgi:hypothetical protein
VTTRTKNVLGLVLFAVFSALAVGFVRRSQRERSSPLDAVPANAFLVAVLDVDLLRKSPLGARLLEGPGAAFVDGKGVATTCGFDPIDRIREVAVAVPMEDDTGEFGVVIMADVAREALVECTRKVLEARGAAAGASFQQRGSFTWIEAGGDQSKKRYPALAYHEGGPYLVARGPFLGAMVETAEGMLPSARHESRHLSLRRELGQTSDEGPPDFFLATVVLPKEMRERLKQEMGAELAGQAAETNQRALMAGVLDVEGAGLGVSFREAAAGSETRALLELHCEDAPACAAVARVIETKRREWSNDPLVRLVGAGVLFDDMTVEGRGKTLRVSMRAPTDEVGKWVERIVAARSATSRSPSASGANP